MTQAQPLWKILLAQFLEHRMAVVGLGVIVLFLIISLMAPLIAWVTGLDPDRQNVFNRYQPPGSVLDMSVLERELRVESYLASEDRSDLIDFLSRQQLLEFEVARQDLMFELVSAYTPVELAVKLETLAAEADDAVAKSGVQSDLLVLAQLSRDSRTFHLLGTDELGRDVLIRLVFGTRVSVSVGLLVAIVAGMIGLLVGSLAGYYGGRTDAILMRITDALLSLPILVVLIVVSAIDLGKVFGDTPLAFIVQSQYESVIKMVLILCLFSWMQAARLVRGSILSIKEQEFILAARVLGARDRTIIGTHIVPNVIAPLLVAVTLGIGNAILFEAALSFLGLGIQPPTPSWGNMLNNAQEMVQHAPTLAILPGMLILFTVISFNYVGDGLRDAIDPRSIRR
ncbi:MAG: ABC transporter permease [Pseudomonadales bacterium]